MGDFLAGDLPPEGDILIEPLAPALEAGGPTWPLAGGCLACTQIRAIAFEGAERLADRVVPLAGLDDFTATLGPHARAAFEACRARLVAPRPPIAIAGRPLPLAFGRPRIMGVLNITPDSFSDGGRFRDIDAALEQGHTMVAAGVDIIDIGGESTRPGAKPVWEEEERQRILPVIEGLAGSGALISVDSRRARVIEAALEAGAHIVNDVSALTFDPDSARVVAASGAPAILMHARGDPSVMQDHPAYRDALVEIYGYLRARAAAAETAGIAPERILIDPGIGFGKTVRHNLALIRHLAAFQSAGKPLVIGVSRKRFIGALSREEPADRRLGGSLAAGLAALDRGAQILRVHDVAETVQALAVRQGLADDAALEPLPEA